MMVITISSSPSSAIVIFMEWSRLRLTLTLHLHRAGNALTSELRDEQLQLLLSRECSPSLRSVI